MEFVLRFLGIRRPEPFLLVATGGAFPLGGICPSHSGGSEYSLIADTGELQERFGFDGSELTHAARYNIAPTQMALTVTNDGRRRGSYMRWGLIPSWAMSVSVGNRMTNARTATPPGLWLA